jgi:hypothetical protein
MTDLTPRARPDREGWWYGRERHNPDESINPWFVYVDENVGIITVLGDFDWYGPVPTAQKWHDTQAELAVLRAMKEPSTLAEIDAAIARLQQVREELL